MKFRAMHQKGTLAQKQCAAEKGWGMMDFACCE